MVRFSSEEKKHLQTYTIEFHSWFMNWVYLPIRNALSGLPLQQLKTISDDLGRLSNEITEEDFSLQANDLKYIKSVLLFQKKNIAEKQENLREVARDTATFQEIESLMKPIGTFFSQDWFTQTNAMTIPKITDFITIEAAYKQLGDKINLNSSVIQYDEKFGILQAPGNFFPRLSNCRIEASLRNVETSIAFIDIDNFKEFNTAYTETRVDRDVLPTIMRTLEAHIFSHGWAFRFGGDEYMLLLPNTISEIAQSLLLSLQKKLENLKMDGIEKKVTVSIGLCTVSSESLLTDREIKQLANDAKEHAKKKGEKNCIAYYQGTAYGTNDLVVIKNA
jgi:diguanylate cyclase (GGDEF)-like protein